MTRKKSTPKLAGSPKKQNGQIVHVLTRIQTVFGLLDDQGNVSTQFPVNCEVSVFNAGKFNEAFQAIAAKRAEGAAGLAQNQATAPPGDAPPEG